MIHLLNFIDSLLWLYIVILIVTAVMSWLFAFDVINHRNNVVQMVWTTLLAVTEPALRPIRRVTPNLGGLDMSFLVLFIGLQFVRGVLLPILTDAIR